MKGGQMYKKIFSVFVFLLAVSMSFAFSVGAQGASVGVGNENGNVGAQEQNRVQVQDGEYTNQAGEMIRVRTEANNRIKLEAGGVSAECECNMTQEKIQNKTKLYAKLSNGRNAEIKIMPDTASETALARLRLKVCSEENNCTIELKEVGRNEEDKQLAYELKTQRKARVFGIITAKMQVKAQINAENGEVVKVQKPWWAFLASEPAEE